MIWFGDGAGSGLVKTGKKLKSGLTKTVGHWKDQKGMDARYQYWDKLSAVRGHAKSAVASGLSCAVSPGRLGLVGMAIALLSPFVLLVFIIFCSNGISYELCAKVWDLAAIFGGIFLDPLPHNFLACPRLSRG